MIVSRGPGAVFPGEDDGGCRCCCSELVDQLIRLEMLSAPVPRSGSGGRMPEVHLTDCFLVFHLDPSGTIDGISGVPSRILRISFVSKCMSVHDSARNQSSGHMVV